MRRFGVRLRVRDVEEFFFCPFVFYLSAVLNVGREVGVWAELGKELQREISDTVRRNFEVCWEERELESTMLGVRGKVDFVVRDGSSLAPLEVKYSSKLKPWWRYTAVLYAMLLEEEIGKPVKRSFVYLTESDEVVEIKIRDEDRAYVLRSVEECYKILEGGQPKPRASKSCENCDYRVLCPVHA